PEHYRTLFALTIVPGAIAVILILLVDEPSAVDLHGGTRTRHRADAATSDALDPGDKPAAENRLPRQFTVFMMVLAIFTLGNSTDAFLLLRLTDVAGSAEFAPLMWSGLHVVKASSSIFGGDWSDRAGRRAVIALGWLIYAVVYAGFATAATLPVLVIWFLIYGLY